MPIPVPELIAKKRDGNKLTDAQVRGLIQAYMRGDVTDYQMSAFAMAVYFQGMGFEETVALTLAMRDSGEVVDLSKLPGAKIDKHSTGGVGDKVSICLAPMVAACGVVVPMMSGRGLGHTGGTLDKLEAIQGFHVGLTVPQFTRQLSKLGCALIGQTGDLAPADKRLYALRDVTATVESIPLITASILSKKLAEGIDGLVLDVKAGRGAFMKSLDEARELARSLVRVGRLAEKEVSALLTRMDAPLGKTIGNALETAEAFEVLHGGGPDDLVECTMALGAEMLRLAGVEKSAARATRRLREVIADGSAAKKMKAVIKAQHGDPRVVDEPDRLPRAKTKKVIKAPEAGYVRSMDPLELGLASVQLGAGRSRADEAVDPAAGIVLFAKPGDRVQAGQPLMELHTSKRSVDRVVSDRALNSVRIGARRPSVPPLVIETIRR